MVSTFHACLWAIIGVLMGAAWGVCTMGLIQAAKEKKEDKHDDET